MDQTEMGDENSIAVKSILPEVIETNEEGMIYEEEKKVDVQNEGDKKDDDQKEETKLEDVEYSPPEKRMKYDETLKEKFEICMKNALEHNKNGYFEQALGDYEEARRCLENISDVTYKARLFKIDFNMAVELDKFENALESINRAFSKHDGKYKPSMLNLRGRIYSALGEYENAIDDYRESYELVQDRVTFDLMLRNKAYKKYKRERYRFYDVLEIDSAAKESKIKKAIQKKKSSLKDGDSDEKKVVALAESVLLDKDLKCAYDEGSKRVILGEYCTHKLFYKKRPF